ncbi:MAG: VTT domain-containing protein [Nitrososphaerales archaeon]
MYLSFAELYSLGYIGIFALSLVFSLIVFVPLPYLAIVLVVALSGRFEPVLLVISSAAGSALGKLVIYQACYSGQRLVDEKTKANLRTFRTIFASYAWAAVFVAAATPIPDDIVYVPLGFARYNRIRFFTATLVGKTLLASIIVYGSGFLANSMLGSLLIGGGQEAGYAGIIMIAVVFAGLTFLLTYFIARFDWRKWIERHFPDKFEQT